MFFFLFILILIYIFNRYFPIRNPQYATPYDHFHLFSALIWWLDLRPCHIRCDPPGEATRLLAAGCIGLLGFINCYNVKWANMVQVKITAAMIIWRLSLWMLGLARNWLPETGDWVGNFINKDEKQPESLLLSLQPKLCQYVSNTLAKSFRPIAQETILFLKCCRAMQCMYYQTFFYQTSYLQDYFTYAKVFALLLICNTGFVRLGQVIFQTHDWLVLS